MKFIIRIVLILMLLGVVMTSYTQEVLKKRITISGENILKTDNVVTVSFDIILDELHIESNNMFVLKPVVQSNINNYDRVELETLVLTGNKRNKVLTRKAMLGNELPFEIKPESIVKRENNKDQTVKYNVRIPYRSWMDNASLILEQYITGCVNCNEEVDDLLVVNTIIKQPVPAVYKLNYIVPNVEPLKTRSDRHTASFNYELDRYELLHDYKNNTVKLNEVEKIIREIQNNTDLKITEFNISGYASPEASAEHNRLLAQNRAESFANYLATNFGVERNRFTVERYGEDWAGLRKAVEASELKDKYAVLDIIDNIANADERDTELMKLNNGETYQLLLSTFYPHLRRTEYVVAYIVRNFDVTEAREIIKTNPRLLSLNEMYLVAQSYPVDSKEFREVFDIATRHYPDSDIAIVNSAAADIEHGNLEAAINRMIKIKDNPKVWNNLGVAYARKGDIIAAQDYLNKSANQNDEHAEFNIKELSRAIKSN